VAGLGRYTVAGRVYDVVSLEWPIYRAGRQAAIELLGLKPGARVLDIGCGTGLNFPLLHAAVGPQGTIVGVDLSSSMLDRAHARVRRNGWRGVSLVQADAGTLDLAGRFGVGAFDAVLATYALSIIEDGVSAWQSALQSARPGARVAIADLAVPAGRSRVLAPLARLACLAGGVDLHRRPWEWVTRDASDVALRVLRGGHVRVAAGTVSAQPKAEW